MSKHRLNRMSAFFKYLVSYIVAIILPVSIFMLVTFNHYVGVIEQEARHSNLNTLNQIQKVFDTNIEELHMIATQIYNSPSFSGFNVNESVLTAASAMNMLRGYLAGTKFISGIGVYYTEDGSGKIYSNSRVYSLQEFAEAYYNGKYSDISLDRFLRTCRSNMLHVNISEDGSRNLTYIVPPANPARSDRIVVFIIDALHVEDVISASQEYVFVKDNDKTIFSTSLTDQIVNNEISGELFGSLKKNDVETVKLLDGEYLASCITSDTTGWSYLLLRPMIQALSNVMIMKKLSFYLLVGMVIFLFVMMLVFSRWSTRPFSKLLRLTEAVLGVENEGGSEFEKIYRRIYRISDMNRELSESAKNNIAAVREFIISSLIRGSFANIAEFNAKGTDLKVRFTLPFYRVSVIQLSGSSQINHEDCQESISLVEETTLEGMELYGCTQIENNRLVFVIACCNTLDHDLQEFFAPIITRLRTKLDKYVTVGIGNAYNSLELIGKSYLEAITAVDYRLVKGRNMVIFYDNRDMAQVTFTDYPTSDLKHLENAIAAGNIEMIEEGIGSMIYMIKEKNMTLAEARCLCFDIITTIIKAAYNIQADSGGAYAKHLNVMELTSFETLEELHKVLAQIGMDICHVIMERRINRSSELIDTLMAYLRENYSSTAFSVNEMADHFGMSVSSTSRLFKRYTGNNISEYVNKLRIEKSKELLNSTDLTLNEIVSKVGYFDTSSFVRKFKKETGTTPGRYRKVT